SSCIDAVEHSEAAWGQIAPSSALLRVKIPRQPRKSFRDLSRFRKFHSLGTPLPTSRCPANLYCRHELRFRRTASPACYGSSSACSRAFSLCPFHRCLRCRLQGDPVPLRFAVFCAIATPPIHPGTTG